MLSRRKNMLSRNDVKLLNKAIKEKDKYKIVVDNDCITLVDKNNEEIYEDFSSYGQDFIVDILQFMETDTDYC